MHERRSHPSAIGSGRHYRSDGAFADRLARGLGDLRQPQRGGRRARHFALPRTHGLQRHGAAHRAPDRRGDRSGRRRPQCRRPASRRRPITRACSRRISPWVSMCWPISCRIRASIPTRSPARRTSSCRRSARSRIPPTISCSSTSRPPHSRASRWAARSSAPRRPCARSTPNGCAPISAATTARPAWWWRRPARSITTRS